MTRKYQPIENYGIIGDLNTVALVCMDGSIDFMCFPNFDSPTIFAAILDKDKGGYFQLAPVFDDESTHKQLYLPESNCLLTRFLSSQGVAEVSDFMPIEEDVPNHDLVRRAKCVRGEITFRMTCWPRFDYARADHTVEKGGDETSWIFASKGPDRTVLRLRTTAPVTITDRGAIVSEFRLQAGEHMAFILEQVRESCADAASAAEHFTADSFKSTINYWRRWVGRMKYTGRWREMMERSALTLKLLVSARHGSLVAAPTFGLPEHIGGVRNWDYRYTWVRDSSFSLYALMRLGYTEEAEAYVHWMEDRIQELGNGDTLQIMYGIDGHHNLAEEHLDHLEGYMGSKPVRIGNGASGQLQLDIYGELMDSIYLFDKYGTPLSYDLWMNLTKLIEWVCQNWKLPDEGIWEVRGGRREFILSRVMCWVALDRAVRLCHKRGFPAPVERWTKVRDEIYQNIFTQFWNPKMQAFVQYAGSETLDASVLLMPLVRFISPKDPRFLSTLAAVERELVADSLVYRYRNVWEHEHGPLDGLPGDEGTFCMCTFWYVECLSRSGDIEKARFIFEKMLGYANHLGLYAEELGPRGEHLGNFPQAFTHLGLISAAFDLDRRLDRARHD